MARFNPPGFGGYQPGTQAPDRRAFFDLLGKGFTYYKSETPAPPHKTGATWFKSDTQESFVWDGDQWVAFGGGGGDIDDAFVGHTNIAGGVGVMWDHINVNVADQDVNGNHGDYLGRGTYRVPETGLYLVTGQAHAFVNNNPQRFIAGLGRMGAPSGYGVNVNLVAGGTARLLSQGGEVENSNEPAGKALASTVAWVGRLEAGDQIGLMTYNSGGNTIALAIAGCVNQLCVTPIRGATGATGATGPQGPPGPPGPPGTGGGSDGFTFVQEATPTADTHGQTWYDTSTGDSFVWIVDADSSQWVQFAPGGGGGGGDGLLLLSETETTKILDTWMDTYSDFTVGNRDIHPFPTIIEVAISGIYIKPDRTHQCSASLLDYNVTDPSNPGYASIADFTQTVTSNGANWTPLGGVAVSAPVAAGATPTIVLRIFGVSGGATGVSFQFVTTSKRYRA